MLPVRFRHYSTVLLRRGKIFNLKPLGLPKKHLKFMGTIIFFGHMVKALVIHVQNLSEFYFQYSQLTIFVREWEKVENSMRKVALAVRP